MKFSTYYAATLLTLVAGFCAHGLLWNQPASFGLAIAVFIFGGIFYPGDDQ